MLTPAVTPDSIQLVRLDSANAAEGGRKPLFGLDGETLAALMVELGEPSWRARQLAEAMYRQRLTDLDAITTLSRPLRRRLSDAGWEVGRPRIAQVFRSVDGTERYLVECSGSGAETVETVWMPEGDGGETGDDSGPDSGPGRSQQERAGNRWSRATICVSSQVGCAVNCKFCLTALLGVKRNLEPGEIVGQIAAVLRDQGVDPPMERVNIVFMGMGEPFLNYENFMKSVRLLVAGVGIPESRMTVSTAGIVPRIHDFGQEPVRPKLAISLNASNDALRSEVMPLNRKWNLEALMKAARDFPLRTRERLTFEYVLLAGVNDSPEHAREVADLVRGMRAKVNLIALNPGSELPYQTPERERVAAFQNILVSAGIPTFVRRPRGRDIFAACGQLKRTIEIAPAPEAAT